MRLYGPVERACAFGLEGEAQLREDVGETLHAHANGPVAQVGVACLGQRVVRHRDDAIERARHEARHTPECLEIEPREGRRGHLGPIVLGVEPRRAAAAARRAARLGAHEARQRDRGEVAHGHLVGRGVLNDLRAQVGAADRA